MSNRRGFIKSSAIASIGLISLNQNLYSLQGNSNRKIKISLNPYKVGINCTALELLELAIRYNFDSIIPIVSEFQEMDQKEIDSYLEKMSENRIDKLVDIFLTIRSICVSLLLLLMLVLLVQFGLFHLV